MSFGSYNSYNPQNVAIAEQEIEMVTDLYNRILDSCHQKCIPSNYADGDLNKGESVCIDRCVAKFFQVNKKVGDKMAALNTAVQEAAAQP
ncbi:hypothetical protein K493DRAFT_257532 [Basidiobolus meristosporus CBS 931.73]|uniref:Mitochondrial import inner membrane translocase subunit n=1 Tax=Basidiobolus meristosporus CBS 931.73 TaxID=1314790 RepID=A0A1Y1W718_9FUNG|nr:hypothetical protein K493DRAFT_364456 [Basidiobolus meristosporus CBS 931.73]ORX99103.1 hypothetical protein K493DRAFT_257532 [Basidiobolus meristosporus CBS 931.73]|eukprot:ORX69327.1 hypothetical protein K493DRAFT_364456 [Basidiobolus meristosporus CBS 931.73]